MNGKTDLVLIGGGGHCKSVIDVAESAGYAIVGIFDMPENVGKRVCGYPIIGTDQEIIKYVDKASFLVTVGHINDASLRIKLQKKVKDQGGRLATLIASTAYVSRYASVGEGTVIMHKTMVNADARIGEGCIINTMANIEHDAVVGDYCHISTGVMVNGSCMVQTGTFIGSQSVMKNGTIIGERCVIAAGSYIRKTILETGIYSGNPAVLKKKL